MAIKEFPPSQEVLDQIAGWTFEEWDVIKGISSIGVVNGIMKRLAQKFVNSNDVIITPKLDLAEQISNQAKRAPFKFLGTITDLRVYLLPHESHRQILYSVKDSQRSGFNLLVSGYKKDDRLHRICRLEVVHTTEQSRHKYPLLAITSKSATEATQLLSKAEYAGNIQDLWPEIEELLLPPTLQQ